MRRPPFLQVPALGLQWKKRFGKARPSRFWSPARCSWSSSTAPSSPRRCRRWRRSFGVAPVDLNVGISAYMLTVAVFIPASGWVTDRFGARVVFASAIATFTLASMLCAASGTLLAVHRGAHAAGHRAGDDGPGRAPHRVAQHREAAPDPRHRAFSPGRHSTAPVIGPPLGGLITTYSSWPWIFLLNVPLGLIGLALALIYPEYPRRRAGPSTGADFASPALQASA